MFKIKHHLVLTEIVECLFEVVKQIPMPFQLHYHIINVRLNISSNLSLQYDLNVLLIYSSPILEVGHHLCVAENSKWGDEHSFSSSSMERLI
jgi:hypothetical protein